MMKMNVELTTVVICQKGAHKLRVPVPDIHRCRCFRPPWPTCVGDVASLGRRGRYADRPIKCRTPDAPLYSTWNAHVIAPAKRIHPGGFLTPNTILHSHHIPYSHIDQESIPPVGTTKTTRQLTTRLKESYQVHETRPKRSPNSGYGYCSPKKVCHSQRPQSLVSNC